MLSARARHANLLCTQPLNTKTRRGRTTGLMPSAARCLRGMVSPERPQQSNNPRCDGRCMREGRQESAGATVGTGVRAGAGAYGRYRELCTREGRHGHAARGRVCGPVHARRVQGPAHARRSAGACGCERTSHHGRSNRCERSSRLGMRAATAKRQPSRINARASRPRPPRAGPRPTGRARRARRT